MYQMGMIIFTMILIIFYVLKCWFIQFYLRKNNEISYEYLLKNFLQVVNKDSFFMNYGQWETNTLTLQEASLNLCDTVYDLVPKKNKKPVTILDVGCGYGSQDFYWYNKLKTDTTFELSALDISQEQIDYAIVKQKSLATNIRFQQGNAEQINKMYPLNHFNTVISLESAFHYRHRNMFFKAVHDVLKPEGTFVITDIMLKNSYKYQSNLLKKSFVGLASELLSIPAKNLISKRRWLANLENSGFQIVKKIDLTKKTFMPHYKYMFYNWLHINNIWGSSTISKLLTTYAEYVQSFSYMVVLCKKV